jgi:hypothetical protein
LIKAGQIAGKIATIRQSFLPRLVALPRPPSDRTVLATVWRSDHDEASSFSRVATASAKLGTPPSAPELKAVLSAEKAVFAAESQYHKLTQSYGFRVCGTPTSATT